MKVSGFGRSTCHEFWHLLKYWQDSRLILRFLWSRDSTTGHVVLISVIIEMSSHENGPLISAVIKITVMSICTGRIKVKEKLSALVDAKWKWNFLSLLLALHTTHYLVTIQVPWKILNWYRLKITIKYVIQCHPHCILWHLFYLYWIQLLQYYRNA